jgi:capsular polysaccharide biosynthesis protein
LVLERDEVDEQILSFKESLRVVLRYRRVAAVIALVGLLFGIAYGASQPALTSAKAEVLLPPSAGNSSSGLPTQGIATDVEIATTPAILNPAAKEAGVSLPYTTLVHRVTVTGVTVTLLQIVAKSSSAAQAERLANDVATTFVNYASNQSTLIASSAVDGWTAQETLYQNELAAQQGQLKKDEATLAAQPPGSSGQTEYTSVVASDTSLLDSTLEQIKNLKTEIALAGVSGSSPSAGASIAQSATTAIPPSVLRIPKLGIIGLLGGLLVGIVVAFGVGRKDRRLRQRDEIAHAAGAPVLASLTAVRRHKSEDLIGLLDHFEPSVIDKANLRRLIDELGVERRPIRGETSSSRNGSSSAHHENGSSAHHENGSSVHHEGVGVHVIVLAGDDRAVAAAAELPAFAASLGLPVALVVVGSSSSTQQLAIACAARDPLAVDAPRPNLLTYATAPGKAPGGVTLAVTLEVVDPVTLDVADIEPTPGLPGRLESALLVVSSGYAKREDLEVVALAAEHHGRPLVGVVVADPDPSDKTSGLQQPRRLIGSNGPRQLAALRSANR